MPNKLIKTTIITFDCASRALLCANKFSFFGTATFFVGKCLPLRQKKPCKQKNYIVKSWG